jgi:hypothetical protein
MVINKIKTLFVILTNQRDFTIMVIVKESFNNNISMLIFYISIFNLLSITLSSIRLKNYYALCYSYINNRDVFVINFNLLKNYLLESYYTHFLLFLYIILKKM